MMGDGKWTRTLVPCRLTEPLTDAETELTMSLRNRISPVVLFATLWVTGSACLVAQETRPADEPRTSMGQDDGYRGIWYAVGATKDEYAYKYSGGLGTYCANHTPLAIYAPQAEKTFFVYGGTVKGKRQLLEMVSYYDHRTGMVPRPTILMNKGTDDAHDNPAISLDDQGYIFVFASSHGTARPSYVFKSDKPYTTDKFTVVYRSNFSYPQPWYLHGQGFMFLHTLYRGGRALFWTSSTDGVQWSEPQMMAMIDHGHYQVSRPQGSKLGTAFMYHPRALAGDASKRGLDWRTNLYYMQTQDYARTWTSAQGQPLEIPLRSVQNPALVHDYESEKRLVYILDLTYDADGQPIILFLTSGGPAPGPVNDPRTWHTARWTGQAWEILPVTTSDNNYDTGSLYVESDGLWRLIGPTEVGPQAYNPGGEMVAWTSSDRGHTWKQAREITRQSRFNHTYARRPVNAHPDFYAFWADGDGRKPSPSRLYFCNRLGDKVYRLPESMNQPLQVPEEVATSAPAR